MLDNSSEILLTGAGSSGDSVFSGFGSDPVGTEIDDSTETTQSDEEGDDFIAELTRQMAENMLQEDEDDDDDDNENSMTSESFDLSVEQSNSTSKYCHGNGKSMSTAKSQTPTSVLPNPTTQIYPNHSQPKHEYRQVQMREHGHGSRRAGFLSAFQAGPGMRVVFLGGVGSRSSGSSGTGVFFPQPHAPNSTAAAAAQQSRKRTGCSTVLIPERVLQTLKHHFEKRAAAAAAAAAAQVVHSNGALHTRQNQRVQSPETLQTVVNNQELQLPQEWTY